MMTEKYFVHIPLMNGQFYHILCDYMQRNIRFEENGDPRLQNEGYAWQMCSVCCRNERPNAWKEQEKETKITLELDVNVRKEGLKDELDFNIKHEIAMLIKCDI
jgi:hypothetical protein